MRLRFPAELAAAVVVTIALCVPTNVLCGSTEAALYRESMEVSIEKGGYTNKLVRGIFFRRAIDLNTQHGDA